MPGLKLPTWRSRKGAHYETAALRFLRSQGLKLIERNFRCTMGEIDLIMRQDHIVVFVEVRFRASTRHGLPCETVDRRKQQKLLRCAHYFLLNNKQLADSVCRFDIVGISGIEQHLHISWIENAFQ